MRTQQHIESFCEVWGELSWPGIEGDLTKMVNDILKDKAEEIGAMKISTSGTYEMYDVAKGHNKGLDKAIEILLKCE